MSVGPRLSGNFLPLRSNMVGTTTTAVTGTTPAGGPGAATFTTVGGARPQLGAGAGTTGTGGSSLASVMLRERSTAAASPAATEKANTITRLLTASHTDRAEEKQILDVLSGCNRDDLNAVLAQVDVTRLLDEVDDRLIGPDNREALLRLLTQTRLGDLNVASRAALVTAVQTGKTDGQKERAVRDIFLGTRGADLTALKNAINAGNDHRDLQALVFHDLDDANIRKQILEHIQREAVPTGQTKVLSDIDDTFYASLKDRSYPSKTVYPGVAAFYTALDQGAQATPDATGDLSFLSARPGDRPGVVEHLTREMIHGHGVADATVMTGDLLHSMGSANNMAAGKMSNYQEHRALFPDYGVVFVGDSGQGDVVVAQRLRQTTPDAVKGAFIHDVVNTSAAQRAEYARQGVFFFDTYLGAAVEAFRLGLISPNGLRNVEAAVRRDMAAITFDSAEQKAGRMSELERDAALAQAALAGR